MNAENYAEIFKALAHPVRLKITCGLLHNGKLINLTKQE